MHYSSTEFGSSGAPIFNLSTNKIIGIHKERGNGEYNIGSFLYNPIFEFRYKYYFGIKTKLIKSPIKTKEKNFIMDLYRNLSKKGLVSNLLQIKNGRDILAQKLILNEKILPKNISTIREDWITAWHGTEFKNLEPLIEFGFKFPGTKLKNGTIVPQPKYKSNNKLIVGIKNWEKAIFASPSLVYACEYAEEINDWCCLVEVKLKPHNFTEHTEKDIVLDFDKAHKLTLKFNAMIYRITGENDIIANSIVIVSKYFYKHLRFSSLNVPLTEELALLQLYYLE